MNEPTHHPHSSAVRRRGLLLATLGAIAFSGKAIIVKLAYRYGVDAVTLIMYRMLFALPMFLILSWWAGRGKPALNRSDVRAVMGLGFSGYYLASFLDFAGLRYISASLERLILYLNPTLVLGFGVLLFGRKVTRQQVVALAVSYAGVLCVFGREATLRGANTPLGATLVFGSAVSYALYLSYSGEEVKRLGALRLTGLASTVACLICIAQFLALRPLSAMSVAPQVLWLSALNATVCTLLEGPTVSCFFAMARHTLRCGKRQDNGNPSMRAPLIVLLLTGMLALGPALGGGQPALPAAKPESVGISAERLGRFPDGMKSLVEQGRLAGVVTMVARHGKVVEFEAAGKRSVAADLPMQKDSIFRIYSMSKPITGVAMMMLFEEGKWQLNDPVAKYIPEFANLKVFGIDAKGNMTLVDQTHPMTMRELMSHTAGFTYGYFSNTPVDKLQREANLLDVNITLEEFIKRVAKLPLNAQPGSEWHYSISADIQGYIVQKLSGMPFEEFLAKRIFKPLNMVDTAFYVPAEKLKRFAELYDYDENGKFHVLTGLLNHDYSVKPALSSGGSGLVSTATDYMRFCQMLLNGGQLDGVRLLAPRTVELMRSNVLSPSMSTLSPGAGFGLDFAVYTDVVAAGGYYGKGTYYWGGAAGTWFWIDPTDDLIVIGMIQQVSGDGAAAAYQLPDVRGLSHAYVYQAILN